MGSAIRSGTALFAPLAGWIGRRAALYAVAGGAAAPAPLPLAAMPEPIAPGPETPAAAVRPLRMLRVVDGSPRACAGRMRMSGRLADVCAELDRLVAREAQMATRNLRAG